MRFVDEAGALFCALIFFFFKYLRRLLDPNKDKPVFSSFAPPNEHPRTTGAKLCVCDGVWNVFKG